ncbi:MAG: type II secretion system protein GspE [Clostridiales bacterium 43-6]|nr:MAG: type II secretion system protein GspE [Clostridiales bacterium 43-6]
MNNVPLGELLVNTNIITQEQLNTALQRHEENPEEKLGDILIAQGYITEEQLMKALEYRFRIPFYELFTIEIPPEVASLITAEIAKEHNLVPVSKDGKNLYVAISDPMNYRALDEVKFYTKLQVKPVLATKADIKNTIIKLYEATQTDEAVQDINKEYTIEDVAELSESINENVDNAPIVRLVNLIINQAINARASDIHIEPMENLVRIRFRIDGVLYEQLTITKSAHAAVTTRLKIMSDLDIAEKRIPQDGRAQVVFGGQAIDLRLSVLPTVNGEKITIRILGGKGSLLSREKLGFTKANSDMFDSMIKNPNGIILVSGPTGSGKSTTLYTILNELNRPSENIITVEDPVEFRMAGINQVQINTKAGLTFAAGLRSILRQDPDIIMLGEIRDAETAEIAVRASITGHLVLSTIHTNDAASTVSRLVDMGIEPFLVSASLVGVVAQRLVRRICTKCKTSYTPPKSELNFLHLEEDITLYKGTGCTSCGNTGYKGRIGIHEILLMNREMRELVDARATAEQLRKEAIKNGTTSLRDNCAELVLGGITTIEELIKVTYSIS